MPLLRQLRITWLCSQKKIRAADQARDLHAGFVNLSMADYKWILQANQLHNCPVLVNDVNIAIKIWGPSVAMMKAKTTWTTPPPVQHQDVITTIPREFREIHK